MLLALVLACAPRAPIAAPTPAAPTAGAPTMAASAATPVPASPLSPGWRNGPTQATLALSDADGTLGPPDARFTLVTYTDYFCPYCAGFWPRLKELLARNPDTRLVLKNYPLEGACNPMVASEGHRFACLAARAAKCAVPVGMAEPMADLLFLYPDHVTPPEMPMFAEKLGIDVPRFSACLDEPATAAAVSADIQSGIAAGIEGTPSVFIGGLEPGWVQVRPTIDIVEAALAEARAGRPLPP